MALGFESYSYGRALGRKRVVVSNNNAEASPLGSSPVMAPLKRVCSGRFSFNSERSRLEALPQDVLVSVAKSHASIFTLKSVFIFNCVYYYYYWVC